MKAKRNQFNLFAELGFHLQPQPVANADAHTPKHSAREEHRGRVMIETMLRCFSNPTVYCNQPTSAVPPPMDWLHKQRGLIELERAARLMQLLHDKPDASLDQIRACATTLTNPEKCGVLSVISGMAPPSREQGAEYTRAFAHCVEFEQFVSIFGNMQEDLLNVGDVERFYQLYGGQGNWGWLDERERMWMRDFNKRVREWRKMQKR